MVCQIERPTPQNTVNLLGWLGRLPSNKKIALVALAVLVIGIVVCIYRYRNFWICKNAKDTTGEKSTNPINKISTKKIYDSKKDNEEDLLGSIQSAIEQQDHVELYDLLAQNKNLLSTEKSQQTLNNALYKALQDEHYATAGILHKNGAKALTIENTQSLKLKPPAKLFLKALWKQEISDALKKNDINPFIKATDDNKIEKDETFIRYDHNTTALFYIQDFDQAQKLIKHGVKKTNIPLFHAMQRGDKDFINKWLDSTEDVTFYSRDIISYACTSTIADQCLPKAYDKVVSTKEYSLTTLVKNNWPDMLNYWSEKGVNINELGNCDILQHCNSTEMLDAIAEKFGENKLKQNLLSANHTDTQYLETFIENFADANPDNYSKLISWLDRYGLLNIDKTKFLILVYAPDKDLVTEYLNKWNLEALHATCPINRPDPNRPTAHRTLISDAVHYHIESSKLMFDFWIEQDLSKPELYTGDLTLETLVHLKRQKVKTYFTVYGGFKSNIEKAMKFEDTQSLYDLLVNQDFIEAYS